MAKTGLSLGCAGHICWKRHRSPARYDCRPGPPNSMCSGPGDEVESGSFSALPSSGPDMRDSEQQWMMCNEQWTSST